MSNNNTYLGLLADQKDLTRPLKQEEHIVRAILTNLTNRKGFCQEWNKMDDGIKDNIIEECLKITVQKMQEHRPKHVLDINYKVVAKSRGISLDSCSCFVCEGEEKTPRMMNNTSLFVQTRTDGEMVVDMFPRGGARLDYRYYDPTWIQVKVGACDKHLPNLKALNTLVSFGNAINQIIITQSIVFDQFNG